LIDHHEPAFVSCFDDFVAVYEPIRAKLEKNATSPNRLLIRRRDTERLMHDEFNLIEEAARNRGFISVELEDLDFIAQSHLFLNAEAIISAHGSGLSNLVFGTNNLKILEINRYLFGEHHLRPWFYLLARGRKQDYMFLNASAGELNRELVNGTIDKLCSRLPVTAENAIWWQIGQSRSEN